jgi:hypothetical protein
MRETKEVAFCVGKLMFNKSLTKMKGSTQTAEHASSSLSQKKDISNNRQSGQMLEFCVC